MIGFGTFVFGEEFQVDDLLTAGRQLAQQVSLAGARGTAHHQQS